MDEIEYFDQVSKHLLAEDISSKTDLLYLKVDFFDIYEDFDCKAFTQYQKLKDDDLEIKMSSLDKKDVVNQTEDEENVKHKKLSLESAIVSFNLLNFFFGNKIK
ncbi:hypothetical protein DMUE_0671 [Dictyocoela muelleri]|nr:hypothetical protein DMUE_0671 [Dictyocoela muelleri]